MKSGVAYLAMLLVLLGAACAPAAAPAQPSPTAVPINPSLRSYHDPSFGWTAHLPVDWTSSAIPVGQFIRANAVDDPTQLLLWTYRDRSVEQALAEFFALSGVQAMTPAGEYATPQLNWVRQQGAANDPHVRLELAIAADGADVHLVALAARQDEMEALVRDVFLPALDSFVPGPADPPVSVLALAAPEPAYWPTNGWRRASPASQGMDESRIEALLALIRTQKYPIHSLTIVRHGYLVLDQSFPPYVAGTLHELHSTTKSVTSAVLGIALSDAQAAGQLPQGVHTPVLELFAPWYVANTDARKRAMTIEHLLTMSSGLEWNEWGYAYESGTGNSLVTMIETSENWTRYVLDRPMVAEPGTTYQYNSGASYLLSSIVSVLTRQSAAEYAEARLFGPLGITSFDWPAGPEGVTTGWGNLRLKPQDLARIGLLYLQRGNWDGQTIIPADWVERSTTDQVADPLYEYGYQWWLDRVDQYAYMAGRFGQVAIVAPRADLVVVFTAELPETINTTSFVHVLFEQYILPAAE